MVCGRNDVRKTTSAVALILWTQKKFLKLPFAYIQANDHLKKSMCQFLVCSDSWTNNQLVSLLFEALNPYTDTELNAMKVAGKSKNFLSDLLSKTVHLCGGRDEVLASSQSQDCGAGDRERPPYDPKGEYSPLPVLVIDDMIETIDKSLIRKIYQKACLCKVFVVITTPSAALANQLCGLNGKERIEPYHLKKM